MASIVKLLALRSCNLEGAELDAEAERCLRGALPSLLAPSPSAKAPLDRVASWLELHAPALLNARGLSWLARIVEDPASSRHLKADALGCLLELTAEERSGLRITTIGAVDQTKRQRAAARKERDRERKRKDRADKGATPRVLSAEAVQPWTILGISRRTFYRMPSETRKSALSEAVALKRLQQEPSAPSSTLDVSVPSRDVGRKEGARQATPHAPRALIIPAEFGSIRRRSLEALAGRSGRRAEVAA